MPFSPLRQLIVLSGLAMICILSPAIADIKMQPTRKMPVDTSTTAYASAKSTIAQLADKNMTISDTAFLACIRDNTKAMQESILKATPPTDSKLAQQLRIVTAVRALKILPQTPDATLFRLKALQEYGDKEFIAIGCNQWCKELLKENRSDTTEIYALCKAMETWAKPDRFLEHTLILQRIIREYRTGNQNPIDTLRPWLYQLQTNLKTFDADSILLYQDILQDSYAEFTDQQFSWQYNHYRLWHNAAKDAATIQVSATPFELRQLHYLTHNFDTLRTDIAEEGIDRFRRKGQKLPACCLEAMNYLASRHHLLPNERQNSIKRIKQATASLPGNVQGVVPRCLLALGGKTEAWEKMDVYDDLSIQHFPDISAVRLPQWNHAYLLAENETPEAYRATFLQNLSELASLFEQAKHKNKTDLLIALALKECDDSLPDEGSMRHNAIATKQSACYSLLLEMNLGDIATPVSTNDGNSGFNITVSKDDASRDEFLLLKEFVPRKLHNCITALAVLEDRGEWDALHIECAKLADLLNRYDVWPLLICQHELRGVSPLAFSELFTHYEGAPQRLIHYFSILRTPHYAIFRQFGNSWKLGDGMRAANILSGRIPATRQETNRILAEIIARGKDGYRNGDIKPDALHLLIRYLGQEGYGDAAIELAALLPDFGETGYPSAVYTVIHSLIERGRLNEAGAYVQDIHRSRRYDYPIMHLSISEYLEATGQPEQARKHYRTGISLSIIFKQAGLIDEYNSFTRTLLTYGHYEDAERLYFNMGHYTVDLYHLAEAYIESEQWEKANYIYEYIIHRGICVNAPSYSDPSHEQIVLTRAAADWTKGMLLFEQGYPAEGEQHIRYALSDIGGHPYLTQHILKRLLQNTTIEAPLREKWKTQEIANLEKILSGTPKHPGARIALDTLRSIPIR